MKAIESRVFSVCLVVLGIVFGSNVFAEDMLKNRDEVYNFVEKYVAGKSVVTETLSDNSQTNTRSKFKRTVHYTELVKTERGLKFKIVANIEQTMWDLSEGVVKPDSAKQLDRIIVSEVNVAETKSTGKLVGYRVITTNTLTPPVGADTAYLALVDGNLSLRSDSAPYTDGFGPGGTFVPVKVSDEMLFIPDNAGKTKLRNTVKLVYLDEALEPKGAPIVQVSESTFK